MRICLYFDAPKSEVKKAIRDAIYQASRERFINWLSELQVGSVLVMYGGF